VVCNVQGEANQIDAGIIIGSASSATGVASALQMPMQRGFLASGSSAGHNSCDSSTSTTHAFNLSECMISISDEERNLLSINDILIPGLAEDGEEEVQLVQGGRIYSALRLDNVLCVDHDHIGNNVHKLNLNMQQEPKISSFISYTSALADAELAGDMLQENAGASVFGQSNSPPRPSNYHVDLLSRLLSASADDDDEEDLEQIIGRSCNCNINMLFTSNSTRVACPRAETSISRADQTYCNEEDVSHATYASAIVGDGHYEVDSDQQDYINTNIEDCEQLKEQGGQHMNDEAEQLQRVMGRIQKSSTSCWQQLMKIDDK
ncbi:hypothetical protein GOP47_0026243, partial [Adiantum capillus-veneris]